MRGEQPPSAPPSGLLHPLALAAIALLVVNDHVLKARYPGWLTGKLSDASGMVFFPLLLGALLAPILRLHPRLAIGRDRLLIACAALTALVFAAIKLAAPATAVGEQLLGALLGGQAEIVRDPSDLLALPFVLVAPWIARRAETGDGDGGSLCACVDRGRRASVLPSIGAPGGRTLGAGDGVIRDLS
ncbi:MAG TPA: hypothetical protein VNO30_00420 [Kofleriaceae bacterium]|nr:hypothetical protein [Kofleriaceae bacterium]